MYTGFSNEKSAEYVILNNLYSKFNNRFSFFYPICFHKRRDDTSISYNDEAKDLRIIACFSRRAKTDYIYSKKGIVTWRENHFRQSKFLNKIGISTISSVPIGSSIEEIGYGSFCEWFEIVGNNDFSTESWHFLDKKTHERKTKRIKNINETELLELLSKGGIYTWSELLDLIREWHLEFIQAENTSFFHYFSGQKPIFIIYRMN